MRALLVGGALEEGIVELVRELAASHDLTLGIDSGAAILRDAGVRVDRLVGDLDSLDPVVLAELQLRGTPIKRFPAEKDFTDLDLALDAAREAGATEVTVCAAFVGRLDHTLAAIGSVSRAADLRPRIAAVDLVGWVLAAGHRESIELSGVGATVSVFAPVEEAVVSCTGFRWELHERRLEPLSTLGVSNVIVAESAVIRVHSGRAIVLSPQMPPLPPAKEFAGR